jgi:hypothetical protein
MCTMSRIHLLILILSLLCIRIRSFCRPIIRNKCRKGWKTSLQSSTEGNKPEWWDAEDDEEVIYISDESRPYMQGGDLNLFDQLPNRPNWFESLGPDKSSMARQTLREISESYLFSLSFLGDYVVQLGVRPPIDVDAKVGDMMTSEQAFSLLEALTSLDPYESNIEYDSLAADELAQELGLSVEKFCYICEAEKLNLPYGMDTVLHQSVVETIRDVYEFDEYAFLDEEDLNDQ